MSGHDEAVDVVVLGDGTILGAIRFAAGATTGGIAFGFGLAHVPANGVPAPKVPQPVITFTTQSDNPRSMLVQTDGKIVVVGQSANLGANPDMGHRALQRQRARARSELWHGREVDRRLLWWPGRRRGRRAAA